MRTVQLHEIADVKLGRQRSPQNHSGDSMRPYLRAANVGWSGLRLDDVKQMNFTDAEMDVFRLRPGDILLGEGSGSAAEVGKPAIWAGELPDCAFQNTLLRVRPTSAANGRYLLHYFKWQASSGAFARGSRGVGIHHLGREALAAWPVPLHSTREQSRIVVILDRTDALLATRRRVLGHLDGLAESVYHTFASAATSHISIEDALRFKSGSFLPARSQESGPYPVYGGNGVNGSHVSYMFDDRKVVVGRVGAYCGAIHLTCARSWITDNALYVSEKLVPFTDVFLAAALRAANLNQFASRSGQPLISSARIRDVQIPVLPLERQCHFDDRIQQIERVSKGVRQAGVADEELFASLQYRAFRGEL